MVGQNFRPFRALHDSACPRCRVRIRPGDEVIVNNGELVHHGGCPRPWWEQRGDRYDALTPY